MFVRLGFCVKEYVWPLPAFGSAEVQLKYSKYLVWVGYLNECEDGRS